jgi:nucleolar GTP-binding protein
MPRAKVEREVEEDLSEAQKLLDLAFHRAKTVSRKGKTPLERGRSLTAGKIGRACGMLLRHLSLARAPFKRMEEIPPFTIALLEEKLGKGRLERSLSRVRTAEERIIGFRREEEKKIPRLVDPALLKESLRRFYGRASSAVREVEEDLVRLEDAAALMKQSPHIDPAVPTVVVVGYPNVGKSSLLRRLTSASPKVAAYPFTTLSVSIGHAEIGPTLRTQVVDTPGMLVRTPKKAKVAGGPEREAMAALETSTGIVIFLIDPTGSCGWPLEDQMKLLERLKAAHPGRRMITVENKVDLLHAESGNQKISCLTGEGIEELVELLKAELRKEYAAWREMVLRTGVLPQVIPEGNERTPPSSGA